MTRYVVEILSRNGNWFQAKDECDGLNETIAIQTFCQINYTTLLDEPFSLWYNDPVMARVKLIDEAGWESL